MSFFLGIDVGTQSIKGIIIDSDKGKFFPAVSVHYGSELPQYKSPEGFLYNIDSAVRHADPLMWLDALDLLLGKMHSQGLPMGEICGISGSGQQHGTVYLNHLFPELLVSLKNELSLTAQLSSAFSRKTAPIWMDASTGKQCKMLRDKFNSKLRGKTGSDAAERFSGPQIMKFYQECPDEWKETTVIHLVSSFMASVLAGENMPIDYGDGAGMNLLDLNTLEWDREITFFTAPDLLKKLPPCTASTEVSGRLAPYFSKYGLRPGIPINVWSGDNPNSLIGCGCTDSRSAVISLGTSDTFSGIVRNFSDAPRRNGHIFGCPSGGFMSLLCFANGSLTREYFRKKYSLEYDDFEAAARSTEAGKLQMLPFLLVESTPAIPNPEIFYNFRPENAAPGEMIRALLESQILTMLYHAELTERPTSIRLTGGASASLLLRQLIADIFQVNVLIGGSAETAALGAAMRAANSISGISFSELTEKFCGIEKIIHPDSAVADKYTAALHRFADLIESRI